MREEAIQFYSNLSIFATMIFIPLMAVSLGASAFQTALIVVAYNSCVFISTYACGRGADIYGRRLFLIIGLAASAASFTLLLFAHDPMTLGIIRILNGICVGMWGPALLAYVFEAKLKLGKVMGFGGLGWGMGVLIAGVLSIYWQIYVLSSVGFLLAFIIALTVPKLKEVKHKIPLFPMDVIKKCSPAYLAILIRHTGATAIWVLLPIYLKDNLGFTEAIIGYTYASNAFMQFVVMGFIDKWPSKVTISIGLALSAGTFFFFQWATDPWQWGALLMMVGVAWAFLFVGGNVYVLERCEEKATSTGILHGSMSLAGIIGPLIGGAVAELTNFDFRYNVYFAVALSVVGIVIFLLSARKVDKDLAYGVEVKPLIKHTPGPGAGH